MQTDLCAAAPPNDLAEKRLLEAIAAILHTARPDLVPRTEQRAPHVAEAAESSQQASTSKKVSTKKRRNRPRPQPPQPWPEIGERFPEVSPALESGLLIDAVKAGLDAMKQQQAEAQQTAGPSGVGKGKRKVVRVRG
jgi:signal recognition particle subunit SRP19